jgi:hypothetical protein
VGVGGVGVDGRVTAAIVSAATGTFPAKWFGGGSGTPFAANSLIVASEWQ